jgi:myo-inositol-1(or 4)-monophosphatase
MALQVNVQELLNLAKTAATAASELVVAGRPEVIAKKSQVNTKTSLTDPVTEMDRAAENLIVRTIKSVRPDDGFIGEEGSDIASKSGISWAIDPIDGTVNYMYGLPVWTISIAAIHDGKSIAGCLVAPDLGKTYFATENGGAFAESENGT